MAVSRKSEERALSADERELVERSHHPFVQGLPDKELADLVKLLRERRDRARDEAHRRRREMRRKAEPRGAAASREDEGSRFKLEVLAMAMRRLNGEAERRRRLSARVSLTANARKALALKQAAEPDGPDFNSRTARAGMHAIARREPASLVRPAERGRLRKAQAVSQAKKDARGG